MALSSVPYENTCKLVKLVSKILCFIIQSHRPICTQSHYHSSIPSDSTNIISALISIFTRRPFFPNSPELKPLAPRLTNEVVETVLKGLKSWKVSQTFFSWASNQHGYKHNCYTFNAMASILSRAGKSDSLRVMIRDILNSRCSFSPGALGFLIRCLGDVGLAQEANELFDQVRVMGLCVPNNYSYNCLLEALSNSSSIDLVEMRLEEMRNIGLEIDKYTLTPVMQVYCNCGKFEEALNVFNKMYEWLWVDAHIYSMLVLSFSKWGEVDKAFELVERMEDQGISLNQKTFCVLIHGFVKESRVDKALQLFAKMLKSGFPPVASLYDVLIGGLCRNKELEKALCIYSEMQEFGIQPDVGILTKLLESLTDESEMIRLLQEIPQDQDYGTMILLYNSVLKSFVSNGLIDKAYCLLQVMMGNESNIDIGLATLFPDKRILRPNLTSFSIVMDEILKNGKLDLALSLFRDMPQSGCKPNVLLCNNLINELCNSNRLEESFEVLKEMKESGSEPTQFTHNSIFGCLCRRKDVPGALNMIRQMRVCAHEPWIKHTTFLVKELCKHGRAVEACEFLSSMVQEGFLPDMVSYSAAISGLINIKGVDQALHLFRDVCSRGYSPDLVVYNILIGHLCKENRLTEAEYLLNEIWRSGLIPSVVTYNLFIDGWCKNGFVDKAMHFLCKMSGEEREPNVITYTTLMDGLCKAGRPDDALMIWNEMERRHCAPNRIAFMALIHGLCKCGRPNVALLYLREMEKEEMKADSFIYLALISAFLSDLNIPSAFEILKEMVDKGNFPDSLDKNYLTARDAILQFAKDSRTSSDLKALIAEGKIPTLALSDVVSEGEFKPII